MYNFRIMLKRLALLAVFGPLATASLLAMAPQGNPANAPRVEDTKNDAGSKGQTQSGTQHEDKDTPKPPSVIVQVEAPTTDDRSADRQEEKEIQTKLANYTWWLVAFTGVLALVGAGQGYFLHQQARHLLKHADHFRTLAEAATDNAKAAKEAADAALKQADHMITSERAWFVCRADMVLDKEEDNKTVGRIGFRYENIGKTPGFITEIGFAITSLNSGQELPQIPPSYQNGDTFQWTAGRGLPIVPGDNMGRRASCELTQAQLDSLRKEKLIVWVHGYVSYRDSFVEQMRETRYCLRLNPHWGDSDSVPFFIDGPPAYNSAT
jgi:hypothetical protein